MPIFYFTGLTFDGILIGVLDAEYDIISKGVYSDENENRFSQLGQS